MTSRSWHQAKMFSDGRDVECFSSHSSHALWKSVNAVSWGIFWLQAKYPRALRAGTHCVRLKDVEIGRFPPVETQRDRTQEFRAIPDQPLAQSTLSGANMACAEDFEDVQRIKQCVCVELEHSCQGNLRIGMCNTPGACT